MKTNVIKVLKIFLPLAFLALFLLLALFSVKNSSPTADEPAHIPAGYGYVKYQDARLNVEHPPILKAISALITIQRNDVYFPKDKFENTTSNFWGNQWQMGIDFIYDTMNDPQRVLLFSRIPMILLGLALGLIVFFWAKQLYGYWSGVVALSLYVFSPTVIAHTPLVTTDVGIGLGVVASLYTVTNYLKTKKLGWFVGSIVAIAFLFLAKFSAFIVLPVLGLAIIFNNLSRKIFESKKEIIVYLKKTFLDGLMFLLILFASALIVYFFYFFFMKSMPDEIYFAQVREVFVSDKYGLRELFLKAPAYLRPVTYYLTGFAYVFHHSTTGHLTYLLGELSAKGWWYYFPVVFALKTQLAFWGFFLLSAFSFVKNKKIYLDETVMFVFVGLYLFLSMTSSLNIGIRHLMPIIPLLFILCSRALLSIEKKETKIIVLSALLVAYIYPLLPNFPNYIAYANELVDQDKKYEYFIDSNLDWGQDLKRLGNYVNENKIADIKVDYFGGGAPVEYYIPQAEIWSYKKGLPTQGYFAISATSLQFAPRYGKIGEEYRKYFVEKTPVFQIGGGSILIYKIN